MINNELKTNVLAAFKKEREYYPSDVKHAIKLGIDKSQYSRIKNGDIDRVLSDANWITLARRYNISLNNKPSWKIVNTPVYQFLTAQFEACQRDSLNYMLCDFSDIGKTEAAMHYAQTHKNAVYIDCSQVKSKQLFIRQLSKEFGLGMDGRYSDVYGNLVYYLRSLAEPSITFLDEWGDVSYETFMEVKALINATYRYASFYAIGAEGLEQKMRNGIGNKKVGHTEMFSRFGKKYGKVDIETKKKTKAEVIEDVALMIIKANAPDNVDFNVILRNTMGEDDRPSLRRIRHELTKNK